MNVNYSLKLYQQKFLILFVIGAFGIHMAHAQKINTDSLLTKAYESLNKKEYDTALQQARLGMKVSPDYLDFQVVIGRTYQLTKQPDSARTYFKRVIEKNNAYQEAFSYLINLELETKNYEAASQVITKAIDAHPENKSFRLKKLSLLQLENKTEKEREYLNELTALYPQDPDLRQRIFWLDSRFNSDRLGIQYSLTSFDRDGIGPWHLGTVQYIRERKWGSLLGRVNYTQRRSNGAVLLDGIQLEGESYFFTSERSYANVSVGYSDDLVFPKWRLGATYFQNLNKGWQVDLGIRYTYVAQTNIPAAIIGVGKYAGPYWFHLTSFLQQQEESIYPALTLTTRYYYKTRFDYINGIIGYGTTPDESVLSGDLDQRVQLDSYRVGLGYYHQLGTNLNAGIQVVNNRQEYREGDWQTELNGFFMLYYRL
ncbi:YaiO family outer membrane beta-barrel protein [Nonlabens marinus]|uniref:YaiO beta-barrel domain-containing protein n=1 Tax=Nonlabens marinus S1-08 TaxID=1454201 RepID=W8VVG0_9FLAO|nr:YaiO family outer membrane beta-barrel protein [Nonlabens marinus]BAO55413.1 hypothetical protein NMS_1404 [Nonlabens marinus S1-08]